MTYLDRHFIEGIRTEEHREIINGEAQFMADMAQILSEERAFKGGASPRLFQHLLQEREAGLDVQLPAQEFSISLSSNAHVVGNIFSARVAFDTPLRYEVKGDRIIASEPLL